MSLRTFAGLLLCNLVWSLNPVMGKWLLLEVSPLQAAWLRYVGAFGAFSIAAVLLRLKVWQMLPVQATAGLWAQFAWVGFLAFTLAPLLQLTGLQGSGASDNAFIVAVEPLVTLVLARVVLGETMRRSQLMACMGALFGFGLLSDIGDSGSGGVPGRLWPNLLILMSLVGEAAYSVSSRTWVRRFPPTAIYGASSLFGAIFLTLALVAFDEFPNFMSLSPSAWLGALWLGPLATAGGYLFWIYALRRTAIASMALTLFIQPVLGSGWGYLLLSERLSVPQLLGCGIILGSVVALALAEYRRVRNSVSKREDEAIHL